MFLTKMNAVAAAFAAVALTLSMSACSNANAELLDDYQSTYDTAQSAIGTLEALIAKAQEAYDSSAGKVADEASRDGLKAVIEEAKQVAGLPADIAQSGQTPSGDELQAAQSGVSAILSDATSMRSRLEDSMEAVSDSVAAKALGDAKAAYEKSLAGVESKIAQTQASLADPGPSADEGVRNDAQAKIDAVAAKRDEIKSHDAGTAEWYKAAASQLDGLTADLETNNAAIHASAGANLQAAADAANAAAQAAAANAGGSASSTSGSSDYSGYSSGSGSSGYSGGSGYSSGSGSSGYQAPAAPSAPAPAPAPSTPSTGGDDGSHWEEGWEPGEDCWGGDSQGNSWAC